MDNENNWDNENREVDSMTVEEAGRKGGETVSEKYGPEFYSKIGRKAHEDHPDLAQRAGKAAHEQHPDLAQRAGHAGGQRVKELIEEGKRNEDNE